MAEGADRFDETEVLLGLWLAAPAASHWTSASTWVVLIRSRVHAQGARRVGPDDVEAHIEKVTHRHGE